MELQEYLNKIQGKTPQTIHELLNYVYVIPGNSVPQSGNGVFQYTLSPENLLISHLHHPINPITKTTFDYVGTYQLITSTKEFSSYNNLMQQLRKMNTDRLIKITCKNLALDPDHFITFFWNNNTHNDSIREFAFGLLVDEIVKQASVIEKSTPTNVIVFNNIRMTFNQFESIIKSSYPEFYNTMEFQYFMQHGAKMRGRKSDKPSPLPLDYITSIDFFETYSVYVELVVRHESGEKLGQIVKDLRKRFNLSVKELSSQWANAFIRGMNCSLFWNEAQKHGFIPLK